MRHSVGVAMLLPENVDIAFLIDLSECSVMKPTLIWLSIEEGLCHPRSVGFFSFDDESGALDSNGLCLENGCS